MCGIAGIRRFDGRAVAPELLTRMADALEHRGPDGHGIFTAHDVGFAHRRLAIIDVDGSPQPMSLGAQSLTITFNGEILNYRALREGLARRFRSDGDTETLLALFERHGIAMVDRLRGQFAFAIHDGASGDLWLARDPLGILPLYYYRDAHLLAFASEIKALAPVIPGGLQLDEAALGAYLARRSVPAPGTLFLGVRKLLPGTWMRCTAAGEETHERYWRIPDPATHVGPIADAPSMLDRRLGEAVDEALVADVPVGAYLSGGVDSSLLVALAARRRSVPVSTFSAGFDDAAVDEVEHARRVSTLLRTDHHEVVVRPADFSELWQRLTWHRDAPLSEPADVAVHRLAELAGQQVKVVLSGEGSDELFGGYPKHRLARLSDAAGGVPTRLRAPVAGWLDRGLPMGARRARTAARALGAGGEEMLVSWFAPFTAAERRRLLGPEAILDAGAARQAEWRHGGALRRMLAHDVAVWLPDNLLERGDRMTMAASVELRPPFLDRRVVELAFSLPSSVKVRGATTKWIVKEVARRYLPGDIVDRRKVGFRVPLARWFRDGLDLEVRSLLLDRDAFVPDVLDRGAVTSLVEEHLRGDRDHEMRIWTLLSLEVWARTFLRDGLVAPRCPSGSLSA